MPGTEDTRQATVVLVARGASALLRAGGRTILGRAAEMFRRAGAPVDVVLAASELDLDALEAEVATWHSPCPIAQADAIGDHLERDLTLVIEGSVVYDKRLVELGAGFTEPTRLIDSKAPQPSVGIAAFETGEVRAALEKDDPSFDDLEASDSDIDDIPLYYPALRRELRPFFVPIADKGDLRLARKTLAGSAGKGHQEWSVVVLNRPVETFLSYYFAEWRITPNQITAISNVTAYVATALFAIGWLWSAMAWVFITVILDGLDGRQARIQIKTSPVGEWEHVFDAISEISWMLALGWHMSSGLDDGLYIAATAAWIAFYAADNLSYTFFRIRRGMMIDEVSPIDYAIRFVGSRRNTSFAYFAIALAVGYPREGFLAVIAMAGLTALAHWTRVAILLSRPPPPAPT